MLPACCVRAASELNYFVTLLHFNHPENLVAMFVHKKIFGKIYGRVDNVWDDIKCCSVVLKAVDPTPNRPMKTIE